jgi:hypothetical protein
LNRNKPAIDGLPAALFHESLALGPHLPIQPKSNQPKSQIKTNKKPNEKPNEEATGQGQGRLYGRTP